jgi:outer membrane lipoprotein carrier protein
VLTSHAVEVALALVLTAVSAAAPPPPSADAEAVARRIEEHHRGVHDMKARFVQSYSSGLLGRELVERGTLAIKRPDRMLWEYREPEKKTFVSNGRKSYFYVPADKQVVVRDAREATSDIASKLLSGRGDLFAEFQVFAVPGAPDRIRLTPRGEAAEVREVILEADAAGRIRALESVDLQGNRSRFRFEDVQENVGLADSLFEFKVPHGVEVVSG